MYVSLFLSHYILKCKSRFAMVIRSSVFVFFNEMIVDHLNLRLIDTRCLKRKHFSSLSPCHWFMLLFVMWDELNLQLTGNIIEINNWWNNWRLIEWQMETIYALISQETVIPNERGRFIDSWKNTLRTFSQRLIWPKCFQIKLKLWSNRMRYLFQCWLVTAYKK